MTDNDQVLHEDKLQDSIQDDETTLASDVSSTIPTMTPTHDHENIEFPVLKSWKTSTGFSILGFALTVVWMIVVGFIIAFAIGFIFPNLPSEYVVNIASLINGLIYAIASVVYALAIYPSYFTEKPKVKSNRAISCMNFLFGSVIFGALWNSNLTNKKKGRSFIVFTILACLSICSICLSLFITTPQYINANGQMGISSSSTKSLYKNSKAGFAIKFSSDPEVVNQYGSLQMDTYSCLLQHTKTGDYNLEMVAVDEQSLLDDDATVQKMMIAYFLKQYISEYMDFDIDLDDINFYRADGAPAASFKFNGSESCIGVAVVCSPKRTYYITAIKDSPSAVNQFIDSFELI